MKKLLFILLAIILLAGKCDDEIIQPPLPTDNPAYVFEKVYNADEMDESIQDLYYYVKYYDLDSVPLGKWQSLNITNGDYNVIQYISTGKTDSLNIIFNYIIYMKKSERAYQVKIRKIQK